MLTKVGTITVHVRDQAQALAFYTEKLHFETRADMPMGPEQRWIEVAPPGAQTRILLYKPTPEAPGATSYETATAKIGTSTGMVLEVDDIVATFDDLKAQGVVILEEPTQQPWGWWGVFAEPKSPSSYASASSAPASMSVGRKRSAISAPVMSSRSVLS
jgi:catechol 2,3-dioxygenase-like lactoylglutathione lyase family enzyme